MFEVDKLWIYGKNKNWKNRYETKNVNRLPVISGSTDNNGVNYYTDDETNENDLFSDSLTISTRGEYSGTVTYHKGKFLLANNILVMQMPKLTLNQKIFIGSLIDNLPYGGYNGYPRKETLKNDFIQLPTKNGEIDFDFMESLISELEEERISELEEERISELDAYLTVSEFVNYELTNDELQAVQDFSNGKVTFGKFEYQYVFNKIVQGRRLKKDDHKKGSIPFVMSGTTNTGVVGYISNPVVKFPSNSITLDIFGNAFYRPYEFGAGDDTGVYWNTENVYSKLTMLFFATAMEKSVHGKFSYAKKLRSSQSLNFMMDLPQKDGEMDIVMMENLITAVQKLVIKDVVLYADKKINATKHVIKNKRYN